MKKHIAKITLFSLFAAAIVALPTLSSAQDASTNAPAMTTKHKHGAPFHGTLSAADTGAMTLTVGDKTYQITSNTKITKDGQPAILSDGVVGQPVSGYYKTGDDGKMTASTVHFGMKGKHKRKSSSSDASTNSPSSN